MLSVFADTFLIATRMERGEAGRGARARPRGSWIERVRRWPGRPAR
jgi:hypothetical protein